MTMEATIYALLHTQCARVFPDVAPFDTPLPYVIYQEIGGAAPTYTNGLPNKGNAFVQVSVWAATRAAANDLARAIEAAMVAATSMQATPQSARMAMHDEDTDRRGTRQDFSVWAAR
jgi:hypothetical protein